jgi:hypothetical protein
MPKYKVTAVMRTYLKTEIEAESLEQAQKLAEDLDGADFEEEENGGEFDIFTDDIAEVK